MIFKLHKIPDNLIFRIVFAAIILCNLKYFFLVFQVPFTLMFKPYLEQNSFYSQISDIRDSIRGVKDFHDEGKIGFVSDTPQASVFDIPESIRDFYTVQYAIVPSILKNDTEETYALGVYDRTAETLAGFDILKKINDKTYLYKRMAQ